MSLAIILICAMLLDGIFGEPEPVWSRIPHPTVILGRVINRFDQWFNRQPGQRPKGILSLAILVLITGGLGLLINAAPASNAIQTIILAILLAQKSLASHVRDVADALRLSLGDGRDAVARIVGRDTSTADSAQISRAAIESAAENLSDGVVAPAFWFLILGMPGLLIYKVVNTADSMIGYKNEKYAEFGWAAARLDDVLNWVPARLTALLIAVAHFRFDILPLVRRDAQLHRSPNAGWPEAAMAACLNVALSGPRSYDGQKIDFPYVYPEGRLDIGPSKIEQAVVVLWKVWGLMLLLLLPLALA